jgi:hypothetical protein
LLVCCIQAQAAQPHMEAALASLEQARASLQNATVDKGGHRAKALRAVDTAIAQVKAGIEFDRRHLSPNENKK